MANKLKVKNIDFVSVQEVESMPQKWVVTYSNYFCPFDDVLRAMSASKKCGGSILSKHLLIMALKERASQKTTLATL